jgi:hypothetical protein
MLGDPCRPDSSGVAETLATRGVRFVNISGYGRAGDWLHLMKQPLAIKELPLRSVRQVDDPGAFAVLCARTGADPGASYFPPYRAAGARASEPA